VEILSARGLFLLLFCGWGAKKPEIRAKMAEFALTEGGAEFYMKTGLRQANPISVCPRLQFEVIPCSRVPYGPLDLVAGISQFLPIFQLSHV